MDTTDSLKVEKIKSEKKDNQTETEKNCSFERSIKKENSRICTLRIFEKIKNRIRKLKNYWNSSKKMIPHIFKLTMKIDNEKFEFHDLSLKGNFVSSSIIFDAFSQRMGVDDEYIFSDINEPMIFSGEN